MNRPLGYRGKQVLAFVSAKVERDGTVPSYAQIADRLDMTTADVCKVVRRLEHRGLLRRRSVGFRKTRGWREPVLVLAG